MRSTVDLNDDVEAMDSASTSFDDLVGFVGLSFGEAGWRIVGGWSFGNRPWKEGSPLGILSEVVEGCCLVVIGGL